VKNMHSESGNLRYNVHFKNGSLEDRVTEREIRGLRPVDIDWVWIVERRRRATAEEVSRLCEIGHGQVKPTRGIALAQKLASATTSHLRML
jgi:hypothetical protein